MYLPESYRRAIARIESGGRYNALGPLTKGDRAYGKYQVMGNNIPQWTQLALGESLTPEQFISNPQAQDATFDHIFGGYADKYGPEGAAQAWFGGPGSVGRTGRKDVLGTDVGSYGRKFMQGLSGGGSPTNPNQRVGGDSMVPRNMAPQVAAQTNTPLFGGLAPMMANSGITPGMVEHFKTLGVKPVSFGDRLSAAGKAFSDAIMPPAQISGGGGDARQSGNMLSQYMQSPGALARKYIQRRMG